VIGDDRTDEDMFHVKRILRKYGSPPDKQGKATKTVLEQAEALNPDFAIGRGIRRRIRDFFFLKTLNRRHRYAFAFFVEKATGFFLSVLAPIAKSGLNETIFPPCGSWKDQKTLERLTKKEFLNFIPSLAKRRLWIGGHSGSIVITVCAWAITFHLLRK
jgi:hypothetical protein